LTEWEVTTMLEDIVVMERSIRKELGTCTLCGYAYPARVLRLGEGDPDAGVRSEYAQVCPACERVLRKGDVPTLPLDESGPRPPSRRRPGRAMW
jgi:hypothetical protein